MAAKKPAAKKTAKSVKSSKTTQAKTRAGKKATYTVAQRKAFQAASRTAIRKVQTLHNTAVFRERHRLSLQKQLGKLRAKGGQFVVNKSRAYAARQAYLQAKSYNPQNHALAVQRAHALFLAQSIATQKSFAFKGQAIHLRAFRTSRARGTKSVPRTRRVATSRSSPYKAYGAEFGRAAAARLPGPSKKRKAARNSPVLDSQWVTAGNDEGTNNCVAVALANHLLYHTGRRMSDTQVNYLRWENRIDRALERIDYSNYWKPVHLEEYGQVYLDEVEPGMLIGYESENGAHCGLLLPDNKVVSWGEIVPLESAIEEAWTVTWTKTSG